jgi:hypothetical protein
MRGRMSSNSWKAAFRRALSPRWTLAQGCGTPANICSGMAYERRRKLAVGLCWPIL